MADWVRFRLGLALQCLALACLSGTFVFQVAGREDACVFMADRWNKKDLPDSRYVWLPIAFGADGPRLEWMETWDLGVFGPAQSRPPRSRQRAGGGSPNRPFSITQEGETAWLVQPEGKRFFSLGVCKVDMGTPLGQMNPTNPSYAAWQHYAGSNQWAGQTLERLKRWGFTTLGAWSDFSTLSRRGAGDLALTPVLHMGSTAGAPWWDMWDAKVVNRMDEVARPQILALRNEPRLLGYYSDNELGWWNAALLHMTLDQAPSSTQRKRLIALLKETYQNDWSALLADFEPEKAAGWKDLEAGGNLYLRPGGNGLRVVRQFLGLLAERYYSLVREIIRRYDQRALILGDRYQSFFFPEVARACSRYVDAVSSNLNASWGDGSFPRFYLESLHQAAGKPVLVSEFYLAARQNRSGNGNSVGVFPVAETQSDRAAGFAATLRALLGLPYVIGADWFEYYDEPPYGRYDGENYNFGLVDIHDRPYPALVREAARFNLDRLKARGRLRLADAAEGVPAAPNNPLALSKTNALLQGWDRIRGFVKPASELPMADLYVCWNAGALYVGLFALDVVEPEFYRNRVVPESDRAEWVLTIEGLPAPLHFRIGAGAAPVASEPGAKVVNVSGVDWGVRNAAAVELPAKLFGRARFRAGDHLGLSSVFWNHGRGYRTEWEGQFKLTGKEPSK